MIVFNKCKTYIFYAPNLRMILFFFYHLNRDSVAWLSSWASRKQNLLFCVSNAALYLFIQNLISLLLQIISSKNERCQHLELDHLVLWLLYSWLGIWWYNARTKTQTRNALAKYRRFYFSIVELLAFIIVMSHFVDEEVRSSVFTCDLFDAWIIWKRISFILRVG